MKKENLFRCAHKAWWLNSSLKITAAEHHDKSTVTITPVPTTIDIDSSENFLKIVFDVGYYVGVFPCHIKYDKTLRDFVICRNKLQMAFCIFVRVVTLISIVNHILILQIDMVAQDPTLYFQLFRRVTFLITITAWFTSTWSKSMEIRTFVALSCKALPGNYRKIVKMLIPAFCLTYAIIGIFGSVFVLGKTYWDPAALMKAYINRTNFNFHLYNFPASHGNQQMKLEIHGPDGTAMANLQTVIFVVLNFFMDFCHDANAWIAYMFMISVAVLTWFQVKCLNDDITNSFTVEINPAIISQKYAAIKTMFNNINAILGPTLLGWICYIVPFTSLKISEVASDPDWFLVIYNLVYFGHCFIFLVLSADSCAKMGCMNEWLNRDDVMMHFNGKKHTALLIELSNNPIAIRSCSGVFAITYGFIGNLFTLMTSFFIIITQFKMAASASLVSSKV